MNRRHLAPVAFAFLLLAASQAVAADAGTVTDEQILKNAGLDVDGASLLAYFRGRTQAAPAARIQELVKELGAPDNPTRDKAVSSLIAMGPTAVPALKEALKSPEIAVRAERCLAAIGKCSTGEVVVTALRLLGRSKPAGATETLLAYLPKVPEESVAEAVAALGRVAFAGSSPDPVLVKALGAGNAEVRGSVAELLARRGGIAQASRLKPLLQDKTATVKLRAAMALSELREVEAIPALIALLETLPTEAAALAEGQLRDLFGSMAPGVDLGADAASRKKCVAAWTAWWGAVDDKAVLDRFRKATLTEAVLARLQGLVKRLGDEDFEVREKASAGLVEAGSAAVPLLLQATRSADSDVVRRATTCLDQIDKEPGKSNPAATCRLVAVRKPAGAAEVLLAYRPFAHDEQSAEEIQLALNAVAYRDGKPEQAILDALADVKVPLRRAMAAAALASHEAGRKMPEVRRCLKDKDPAVRCPVALALARTKDREAFGTLIDVLADAAAEQLVPAEELLFRLSAGQPPAGSPGKDQAERVKFRDAWAGWWRAHGAGIDLEVLDDVPRQLGYTLAVIPGTPRIRNGRVLETARDGKVRWEINGLQYPVDAQVLPNGHVLITEYEGHKVTERTTDNKVVWQQQANPLVCCQRLANGNTFIVCRNQIFEVDRDNKEVYSINRLTHDIRAAQKLKNGEIACVLSAGHFVRLDVHGKELKGFAIGSVNNYVQFDLLPNGNVLLPFLVTNKVIEFDSTGKQVWEATTVFPWAATRLPNGRTLCASQNNQIVELDRTGKVVWQQQLAERVSRARRR